MLSVGGSGILGLLYWYFATHVASQKLVGQAAAEIAAITLLSTLSQLSFGSVFQRYLPGASRKAKGFVLTAYSICIGLAIVIAASYTALGFTNRYFAPSLKWSVLFIFTVALYTIFGLQDYVLISLRVSRWVAVENNLFGVAKIILVVPLAAYATGQGIILSWTIPTIGTVVAVNWYIFRRRLPDYLRESILDEPLPTLRRILGLVVPQYTSTLLSVFSTSVVALIVIAKRGATENAYYYLAAQIAGPPTLLLWNVSRLLIVEAAHEVPDVRRLVRHAVTAMTVVVVIGMGFGIIFTHQILGIFGASYADHGATLLRLLLLSLPGAAVAALYYALAWIDGRLWYLMVRQAVAMLINLSIILAFISREGINVVGYAAVITSGVEFLLFLPITVRRIRAIPPAEIQSLNL